MNIVQLMASPFFGGPERQMLGLALALPKDYRTTFLSFSESGRCRALLAEARSAGIDGIELKENFPNVRRAVSEVAGQLRRLRADVVCTSGYKPDLLGWLAARQAGVPVVSVSHGWTAATLKVRVYEWLDKRVLPRMAAVVCVSEGQAVKVRRAGVKPARLHVIRNAVSLEKFGNPDPAYRQELEAMFPAGVQRIVGAAGRLSPEKGFEVLIEAAAQVAHQDPTVGFVVFGEGPLRGNLERLVEARHLHGRFVMPGFRNNLEQYLPHFDRVALSSYTEGLPVIVLEAFAASTPVVATAVGGVPEVIEDGQTGYLVPAGDAAGLAAKIAELIANKERARQFGERGRRRVEEHFTFAAQSIEYQKLFESLIPGSASCRLKAELRTDVSGVRSSAFRRQ
jgi:glycosyltransferase involved in cell wall biosynthesis